MIAILMGSESDRPVMQTGIDWAATMQIEYEIRVLSVHRDPDAVRDYCLSAKSRGIKIIIAAAGGSAHLPGMCRAWFQGPVIAVPIAIGPLQGLDAVLANLLMPTGVPVAVVGINASKNAVILARDILLIGGKHELRKISRN